MANTKITSALLIATAAFISVPVHSQTAKAGKVGIRAGDRVGGRVMNSNQGSVRNATESKVGARIAKPTLQNHNAQSGSVGKRYLKKDITSEKVGGRAYKPRP